MLFSKTCEYGIRAVIFIASHTKPDERMGIKEVSTRLDIPQHFLGKILQTLTRKGLVSSLKGPTGGFFLTQAQRDNTVVDIVEAIDGVDVFTKCGLGLKKCSASKPCPVHFQFKEYRDGIERMLTERSIDEMAAGLGERKSFI